MYGLVQRNTSIQVSFSDELYKFEDIIFFKISTRNPCKLTHVNSPEVATLAILRKGPLGFRNCTEALRAGGRSDRDWTLMLSWCTAMWSRTDGIDLSTPSSLPPSPSCPPLPLRCRPRHMEPASCSVLDLLQPRHVPICLYYFPFLLALFPFADAPPPPSSVGYHVWKLCNFI